MASFQVQSGGVSLSGAGTVLAAGLAGGGDGPAHVKVAASAIGKRINIDFVGLSVSDSAPFAAGDSVSIANNGNGYTTVSK